MNLRQKFSSSFLIGLTLVLVDDPGQKLPTIALADQVAGRIGQILVAEKVIGQFVPTTAVTGLRAAEADFDRWAIDRVGRIIVSLQDGRVLCFTAAE